MTLTLELDKDLAERLTEQARRQGVSLESLSTDILRQKLSPAERAAGLHALFQSWLAEESDEQRETGEYLIKALDEDRLSERKLFPPELKGISW